MESGVCISIAIINHSITENPTASRKGLRVISHLKFNNND